MSLFSWICILLAGCDSGGRSLATSPDGFPTNAGATSNTVTVDVSRLAKASRDIARMEVVAFSLRGAELARQKAPSTLKVSFPQLPAGSARLRVVAYGDSGEVLGFSDTLAPVPNPKTVEPPPLNLTDRLPPPATPGAPFLAFMTLPSHFQAGETYRLEVGAFNALGQLDTNVEGSMSLSSYGVPGAFPTAGLKFTQGRATIDSVNFRRGTNGTVTFTASAGGFASATSPTLPVRSRDQR